MTKVEAAKALAVALADILREESEAVADRVQDALDGLLLLPNDPAPRLEAPAEPVADAGQEAADGNG